jgi:hypothetical protein
VMGCEIDRRTVCCFKLVRYRLFKNLRKHILIKFNVILRFRQREKLVDSEQRTVDSDYNCCQ